MARRFGAGLFGREKCSFYGRRSMSAVCEGGSIEAGVWRVCYADFVECLKRRFPERDYPEITWISLA